MDLLNIEWQHSDFVSLKKQTGSISGTIIDKLGFKDEEKIVFGFSKDRKNLFIKKANNGVNLSTLNSKSNSRTFSTKALVKQFGEEVIGAYEFEEYAEEECILVLKKL